MKNQAITKSLKTEKVLTTKTRPLNLVIILDRFYEEEEAKKGNSMAMSDKFYKAILQGQNVLVNASLLRAQYHLHSSGKQSIFDHLDITKHRFYLSHDKKYIVFLSNRETPELSGFNTNFLLPIDDIFHIKNNILNDTLPTNLSEISIDVPSLKHIFEANNTLQKIIYLSGHGIYKKTIAGMSFGQYNDLLRHFDVIGCTVVYVSTCYFGGLNLVLSQQVKEGSEQAVEPFTPNFPIIVEGITDTHTSYNSEINFFDFFIAAEHLFEQNLYSTADVASSTQFAPMVLAASGVTKNLLENTPQIYWPAKNYSSLLYPHDDGEIIGYPSLDQEIHPTNSIKIDNKKNIIFLYPSVLSKTIELNSHNLPTIISMIPGDAQHYIDTLVIDDKQAYLSTDISTIIWKLFYNIDMQHYSMSKKLFFIRNLILKNNQDEERLLHNVMIYYNADPNLSQDYVPGTLDLYWEENGERSWQKFREGSWGDQHKFTDKKAILNKITTARAHDEAISHISNGRETSACFWHSLVKTSPQLLHA